MVLEDTDGRLSEYCGLQLDWENGGRLELGWRDRYGLTRRDWMDWGGKGG
jgi:hypothetical protein